MAVYAFASRPWHAMAIAFLAGGCATSGMVVWGTLTQSLVPHFLQGRVRSLDWLLSIGLLPVSYTLTGPIAGIIGVRETLIGAGVLGGIATLAFMLVPGLYDTERDGSVHGEAPCSSTRSTVRKCCSNGKPLPQLKAVRHGHDLDRRGPDPAGPQDNTYVDAPGFEATWPLGAR